MTSTGKGSNSSKGGKNSGIVGFQKVTTGKDTIPEPSTVPNLPTESLSAASDAVASAYDRFTKATLADEYDLYGIDPADVDSSVDEATVKDALALLKEVRDNYRFGLYRREARIQTPTENINAGAEAYELLGYDSEAARRKVTDLYVNTAWEAPDGGYDSKWRR